MHNLTPKKQAQGLEIALKSAKTSCLIKDTLYQIIRATHPSIPNPLEQFSYDEVGNRLTDMTHNAYQYNELNQLTEDDSCRYAYDLDGNMTEKIDKATGDTTHFVYDIENKLIEVRKPGMLAKYSYDALGRRMSKEVNGEVKQFRYDGGNLVLEMNGKDSITANYTYAPEIDNPLQVHQVSKSYYRTDQKTLTDIVSAPFFVRCGGTAFPGPQGTLIAPAHIPA
jgi:YD repeat-containing protein